MNRRTPVLAAALAALLACGTGAAASAAPATPPPGTDLPVFDVQAHRGGVGLNVESSVASFSEALRMGVTTLELDVQITEDGYAVVTHDRRTTAAVCRDTAPAMPGDPDFPYVGKYVKDLTLAQVRTLDCGSVTKPQFPEQEPSPGARMMLLTEVFDLVRDHGADDVMLNVETKVEAGAPHETAPREQFVQVVTDLVRSEGMADQVTIQSFDWGALMRVREVMPELPIVALTNGQQFLQVGMPGASPWLGGIDIDDFDGDLVAAVDSFGADALSPVHGAPQNGSVDDPGYVPFTTQELVDDAHAAGIRVVPWTVDDRATMEHLVDLGVDGLITDRPDVLRDVLADRGYDLPAGYTWAGETGLVDLVAQARCLGGRAYVAVKAVNGEPAPVEVRLATPYGTALRAGVRPDAAAFAQVNARAASIPAGQVTVTASVGGAVGHDAARPLAYDGVTC
ncbi:glycerophosphodiester phosphodiesterase family protein [Cellulosimicrobium marinum]|uniref:glycerophosphodiester phosphodiesterase family protein n=1 Tax=Cellulosimicrobium marinum TaxID=1638992 RepID=UPI0027DF1A14|nr:glycerophosphodiester phosphodiesterase family protein [Cellulosimicrobium marinum]